MPLRPATFAPYPAPDKRAAARERYFRALEEARKAKEAYADTLSDGEEAKKETETEQLDHHPSSPAAATTTEIANSNSSFEGHKRREEPMTVDPVDPLPARRADSPLAQTEPLLRQPSPAIPAAVAPVSLRESAPAPTAATSKAGCDGSHKACHLTSWLRASMGIPSVFAAFPKTASPVDPHPQRIETTMPAPIPGPPPITTPAAAPASSDNDCAHRRRAALNVATLSEQQPPADFKSTSSFARTDSSASSSSRLDTRQRRPDDGFRVTDDHRSQPSPSSSSSSHHGFPPAAAAPSSSSSSSAARDGWFPRGGSDLCRRPEFPPTQLAPLPPPRSRSDSTSDDGSGSASGSGTVLPPLRETSGWRYGQPSQFTSKYVWDEHHPPSSPSSSERQQRQLPSMSRGSSSSSRSHLPLLAAAAATVEANNMHRGSDSAPCLKRHERDWDSDRDQEDSRRSRDRPWESSCLVSKGLDGHKREVGEHLFGAAYSSSRRSDGSSPRRIPREPAAPAPHGLADLPRAFAALTSGSPLATAAAPPLPTSIKYPLDFMRPGRGESVMPEPVESDERVMPSPIDNNNDDDDDVPMREEPRGRSRSRSRSPASTLTASSSAPPRVSATARRSSKGKEPATTTPRLPGLAGLAPLPPLARALPQLPLPAPKPRPPSPTPQRIPLFVCEESSGASACVAAAEEPDAASADALSEIGRLSTSLESLKHAFTFPSADQLDFGSAVWPAGFSRTTPTSTETEGPRVRLPVTARNLTVHAYEHALHKLLGRLDGVGAARVRGVREARKKVVGNVREELARLDDHVQGAARAWLARNPDVSLP